MNITIDKNLQQLRAKRGESQGELADFLGVSHQTVSKWERGENMPDITLLPAIAGYYDVSVDDLLGVGQIRKEERIEEYAKQSFRLQQAGKIAESVELWREARKEFPNDLFVLHNLSFALCLQFDSDTQTQRFQEAAAIDERILRESTDSALRSMAIGRLCRVHKALGNREKALEYAEMAGPLNTCAEFLKLELLEGQELDNHVKRLIMWLTNDLVLTAWRDRGVDALERNLFVVRLMELVYDDGFMGFYAGNAALAYFDCAKEYARRGEAEKVRAFLEKTAKVAKQADATSGPDAADEVLTYGATLLKGFSDPAFRKITNYPGSLREDYRRKMIEQSESVFAPYRETDWFKEVISDLENG